LRNTLQASFALDGATIHLDASLGVALAPDPGADVSDLLHRADMTMYRSKSTGTAFETYSSDCDSGDVDHLSTTEELRPALYNGQLILHYQPKLTLATGAIEGVEALVRWQHPRRGPVRPDDFLPWPRPPVSCRR
jgi:predicted signal transduction protein with EAL and GGDEF domain